MARRKFFKDEENPYDYATDGQVVPSNSTTEYRDEVKDQSEVLNVQPTDTIIHNIDEAARRMDTAGTGTIKVGSDENTAGINRAEDAGDVVIWAGETQENRDTAPFRVYANGVFVAGNLAGKYLQWDGTALSVNGTIFGPPSVNGTSGEAISIGNSVCIKSDGLIYKTNSTISGPESFGFMGFASTATSGAGETITVTIAGISDGFTDLQPGAYYTLNGTPGHIEQTRKMIDWVSEAGVDDDSGDLYLAIDWRYNTFKSGSYVGQVKAAQIWIKKVGTPNGVLRAHIFDCTGTPGAGAEPTGSALATSNSINCVDLTTSYQWIQFVFDTPAILSPSTNYCIVMETTNTINSAANATTWGIDATLPTKNNHGGNSGRGNNGTTWTVDNAEELAFMLYSGIIITNPSDVGTAISSTQLSINPYGTIQKMGQITVTALGQTAVNLGFRPQYIQFFATQNTTNNSQGFADENSNMCSGCDGASGFNNATLCVYMGSGDTSCRAFITDTGFILDCTVWDATVYLTYIAIK